MSYEPDTVAVIAVDLGEQGFNDTRGFRIENGWATQYGEFHDRYVSDVRPLVTLDPFDLTGPQETGCDNWAYSAEEAVKCLRRLAEGDWEGSYRRKVAERIAAQIEAQTKPPKPAEPTGLGAVVEDAKGRCWVRASTDDLPWTTPDGDGADWDMWQRIDAVTVLSEGVA